MAPLSLDNPLVQTYIFYAAILCGKMLLMSVLTGRQRFRKGAFANPEDAMGRKTRVKFDDEDVERVRRAHRNDLENIPVFLVLAPLYLLTSPAAGLATLLCRLYAAGRLLHTVVYSVVVLPQPARALAFGVPYLVTWYMAVRVALHFATAL